VAERNALLLEAAERFGTPAYVYDMDEIGRRARTLKEAFGGRLAISYAVKANPNLALLRHPIPPALWDDLRRAGLLHPEAPVPA